MIDRKKIAGLISGDDLWGKMEIPDDVRVVIPDRKKSLTVNSSRAWPGKALWVFSGAAAAVIAVCLVLFLPRGEKLVISKPYNGEKSVDLIGSFNRWEKKIVMKLDRSSSVWRAEVRIPGKGIYEYQFIIDDLIYTAGDGEYRIRDGKGGEKAVVILS